MKTAQSIERAKELLDGLIAALPTDALEKLQQDCAQLAASFQKKHRQIWLKPGLLGVALLAYGFCYKFDENLFATRMLISAYCLWVMCLRVRMGLSDFEVVFAAPSDGKRFSYIETVTNMDDPANLRFWNEARQGAHGINIASVVELTTRQKMQMILEKCHDSDFIFSAILFIPGAWFFSGSMVGMMLMVGVFLLHALPEALMPKRIDPDAFCEANAYTTIIQVLDSRGASQGSRRLPTR